MQPRRTQERKRRSSTATTEPQPAFRWRSHWGARTGAGRRPGAGRRNVRHRTRPRVRRHDAQHVTLRLRRELGWLRGQRLAVAVLRSLARGKQRFETRLVHFSVQGDHVHLIVEAADKVALSRSMKGLSVRIARAVNKALGRKGTVFADRYHARGLASPREVRHALAYVLCNFRHHVGPRDARPAPGAIDPLSSAWCFDGWRRPPVARPGARPRWRLHLCAPAIWLLREGWRRAGLIDVSHVPGAQLDSGGHPGTRRR